MREGSSTAGGITATIPEHITQAQAIKTGLGAFKLPFVGL